MYPVYGTTDPQYNPFTPTEPPVVVPASQEHPEEFVPSPPTPFPAAVVPPVVSEPVAEATVAPPVVEDSAGDELMAGVEKVYSTNQAAEFFDKSNQWLYWGLRNNIFTDLDGKPIEPVRIGKGQRRRFTLPIIREIALACYRRGNLKEDQLRAILRKVLIAEHGESSFDVQE